MRVGCKIGSCFRYCDSCVLELVTHVIQSSMAATKMRGLLELESKIDRGRRQMLASGSGAGVKIGKDVGDGFC